MITLAATVFAPSTVAGPHRVRAVSPPAPHEISTRAAIAAAYDQINAACHQRDLERAMSYFAPDYVEVDAQGVAWGRDQLRRQYQDWLDRVHTMKSRYEIQGLTVTSCGILADVRAHTDGTGERRILLARVQGTFTNDLVVRDLWVKTPGGWRIKHRQTLLSETHLRPQ